MKKIFLFFMLLLVLAAPLSAQEQAHKIKRVFTQQVLEFMKTGDLDKAAVLISRIKKMAPKDPLGYMLAVQLHWMRDHAKAVIWEVYRAEVDHGVQSLHLYQEQAKALYILGSYPAVPQVLDKIEDFLRKQAAPTGAQ
jgi:hypothetical protein